MGAVNTDVTHACVVLEIEADLVALGHPLQQSDAERLWAKVFQMSDQYRDKPPAPNGLARELMGIAPRAAAVRVVAGAFAAVSTRPVEVEAESLGRKVEWFLGTPEGRERKAHIDRSAGQSEGGIDR